MFYLPMCQWTAFWSDLTEQYSVNWDHYYLDVVSNHSVNTHIILDSIIVNVHCIFIIRTFFSRFCSMTRTRDSSQIDKGTISAAVYQVIPVGTVHALAVVFRAHSSSRERNPKVSSLIMWKLMADVITITHQNLWLWLWLQSKYISWLVNTKFVKRLSYNGQSWWLFVIWHAEKALEHLSW